MVEESRRMEDSIGEEDWDSEIEIEEVEEDNQITKENETVSDVNANVKSKGESPVKEHLGAEETVEELSMAIKVEQTNTGEGADGRSRLMGDNQKVKKENKDVDGEEQKMDDPVEVFLKVPKEEGSDESMEYEEDTLAGDLLTKVECLENEDEEIFIEETNDDHKKKGKRLRGSALKCKFCFLTFVPNKFPMHLLQIHRKDPETVKETCRHCKERVFSLRLHGPLCSEATEQCPHCDKRFCLRHRLNEHIKFRHNAAPKLKCHLCSSTFFDARSLRGHLLVHDASNYQNCRYCTRKLKKRSILAHEQMCKEFQDKKKFKEKYKNQVSCRICSKLFRRCYYSKHLKNVHNTKVKPQQCSYCEKRFHPDLGLKDHEESCRNRKQGARKPDAKHCMGP